jgi:non-heme chloroperoxidase
LAVKLLRNGTLKTYSGYPHGMMSTHPEVINRDILDFIRDAGTRADEARAAA